MKYVFKSSDERNVGQTEACRPLSKKKKKKERGGESKKGEQGRKRQGGKGWREGKKEGREGGVIAKL